MINPGLVTLVKIGTWLDLLGMAISYVNQVWLGYLCC